MKLYKKYTMCVIVLFLVSIFALLNMLNSKMFIVHDEGISLLASSCHQGIYYNVGIYNTWVSGEKWKNIIKPEKLFCFLTVARDLQKTDIHPPFYFWLLHIFLFIFKKPIFSIILLNYLFLLLSSLFIFLISKEIFKNNIYPALITVFFILSPNTFSTAIIARQYLLLTLVTLIYTFLILKLVNNNSILKYQIFLALTLLVGILTSYYFIIFAGPLTLFLYIYHYIKDKKKLIKITLFLVIALVVFLLIMPKFLDQLKREKYQRQDFKVEKISYRWDKLVKTLIIIFVPEKYSRYSLDYKLFFKIIIFTSVIVLLLSKLRILDINLFGLKSKNILVVLFALIGASIPFILYMLFLLPRHVMSHQRYVNFFVPFFLILFFKLGTLMNLKNKIMNKVIKSFLIFVLLFLVFFSFLSKVADVKKSNSNLINLKSKLSSFDYVIVDNFARGSVTTFIFNFLDERQGIYIADRIDIMNNYSADSGPNKNKSLVYVATDNKSKIEIFKKLQNIYDNVTLLE